MKIYIVKYYYEDECCSLDDCDFIIGIFETEKLAKSFLAKVFGVKYDEFIRNKTVTINEVDINLGFNLNTLEYYTGANEAPDEIKKLFSKDKGLSI